ncbi:integrase core domain-containing protein [Streptomyces sp. NBC_00727]|uniref:integrase core domain-containing protein n=1 Tax=Streptomyces sp. NBC_00727 TaxID=2903675 RepID=UPI003864F656
MTRDEGNQGLSQKYHLHSYRLAAEAGEIELAATALRGLADQAVDLGHIPTAVRLAEACEQRGRKLTSHQFRALLGELDIRQSAGGTGSCFDNAAAESFFAVLKAEIGTTAWETRAQARQDVFRWIAEHYNRERIHSAIGYITPYQARVRCHQRLDLAA